MHIKFRMDCWGKFLLFQVLKMDEKFRGNRSEPKIYHTSNGLFVKSQEYPEISDLGIYLHGCNKKNDMTISIKYCKNETEAKKLKEKCLKMLQEWSSNWFEQDTKIIKNEQNVYEF